MNKLSYQQQDGVVLNKGLSGISTLGTCLIKHLQSIVQANYLQRLCQKPKFLFILRFHKKIEISKLLSPSCKGQETYNSQFTDDGTIRSDYRNKGI